MIEPVTVLTIVGARPNFIKLAALHRAFTQHPDIEHIIVHTGQHYDQVMNEQFFQELKIPEPNYHLGIGSGTHAEQIGRTMISLEPILQKISPHWLVLVGDVNATLAGAVVGKKLGLRIAHVEAGLRSGDWNMPEEINRVVTDRLCDLLLTTEVSAVDNLKKEGVEENRIHFVGNVMIDTLLSSLPLTEGREVLTKSGLKAEEYALVTMHRPSNTDPQGLLLGWMKAFEDLAGHIPVVFPVHPRTRKRLEEELYQKRAKNLILLPPQGYLDMLTLIRYARVVMTDSGGIQEESTVLGVPCLTLRDNTERPITIHSGTNRLIGARPDRLKAEAMKVLSSKIEKKIPEMWDGKAGERIAEILLSNADIPKRQC